MNSIKQEATEHVERSVRNLRRGLALNTFLPDSAAHVKEYETRKTQQEKILIIWEYILSCVTYPRDEAVEEIHYEMTKYKSENEQLKLMNESLNERLEIAHERVEAQKQDIKNLEKQLENFYDKSLATP